MVPPAGYLIRRFIEGREHCYRLPARQAEVQQRSAVTTPTIGASSVGFRSRTKTFLLLRSAVNCVSVSFRFILIYLNDILTITIDLS